MVLPHLIVPSRYISPSLSRDGRCWRSCNLLSLCFCASFCEPRRCSCAPWRAARPVSQPDSPSARLVSPAIIIHGVSASVSGGRRSLGFSTFSYCVSFCFYSIFLTNVSVRFHSLFFYVKVVKYFTADTCEASLRGFECLAWRMLCSLGLPPTLVQ